MKKFFADTFTRLFVGLMLVGQTLLLGWIAMNTSITSTEVGHLGGIAYANATGYHDVMQVNPPLVRWFAGIPFYLNDCYTDTSWQHFSRKPLQRCEFAMGEAILSGPSWEIAPLTTHVRRCVIPLVVLGTWAGYCFSAALWGRFTGFCFLFLWVFNPLVLGWGATFNTDVPAASMGLVGLWAFWYWTEKQRADLAVLAGVTLGLMILTKLTWIIAVPIWCVLYFVKTWDIRKWVQNCNNKQINADHVNWQFVLILFMAWLMVNIGYGFDGTFKPIKDYTFYSTTFSGNDVPGEPGNRLGHVIAGYFPGMLPQNMIQGIDLQRYDLQRGVTSYVNGYATQEGGWWWYYIYGMVLKNSVFLTGLFFLALFFTLLNYDWLKWTELVVLIPFVMTFVFVSSQTGFSEHVRYIIPAMAFLMLYLSMTLGYAMQATVTLIWRKDYSSIAFLLVLLCGLGLYAYSSLKSTPYQIAYFNELIKDEDKGRYLLGSNVDWGHGFNALISYIDDEHYGLRFQGKDSKGNPIGVNNPKSKEGNRRPFYVGYTRSFPYSKSRIYGTGPIPQYEPKSGWILASVNEIFQNDAYKWIQRYKPVRTLAGGAIWVIYVPEEDIPKLDVVNFNE